MILTNLSGDIIAILAIVLILGGAILYIVKAKKSGVKCIGCPHSKVCKSNQKKNTGCNGESCSCCSHNDCGCCKKEQSEE